MTDRRPFPLPTPTASAILVAVALVFTAALLSGPAPAQPLPDELLNAVALGPNAP